MQPTSEYWLPAMLTDTLNIVSYAEVWTPPSSTDPNGVFVANFQVVDGNVTVDATNAIRRQAQQITMVPAPEDPEEGWPFPVTVPNTSVDALYPEGNEMILYKGYWKPGLSPDTSQPQLNLPWLNGGSTVFGEVVPLGRFLIEDVEIYNAPGSGNVYIEVNGRDRGGRIDRAKFTVPYATDGVSTLDVQLAALLNFAAPNLTLNIEPSTVVPPQMTFNIGDSPWTSALALAAAGGYEVFADVHGTIVARPALNPDTTAPSISYETGAESIVTSIQRSIATTAVPNVIEVISQGSNIAAPIASYWWDSDQNSPTFYNDTVPVPGVNMSTLPTREGTYPTTAFSVTGAAATTQGQNDLIALAQGYGAKGSLETIDVKIRDNPAHDVEDVIGLYDPATTLTAKLYVLDTLTVQMTGAQEMELKGRLVA